MIRGHLPRRVQLAVAAATLTVVSACTSSATTSTSTPRAPSTPPTPTATPVVPTPLPPPTTSAAPASSSVAPTPAPTPTTTTTTTASAPPPAPAFITTCAKLTVRVIPGGAERGAEIAALQYVNNGPAPCTIGGFPTAVLLLGGKAIGTPSQANGRPVTTMTLRPGDTAESLLTDFSTCQAPLSDSVRVSMPARNGRAPDPQVGPARLRACTLRVAPVGPPA